MLIRVILLAVLFYVVNKVFGLLFSQNQQPPDNEVKGRAQSKPLDVDPSDVEDVNFKELPK